MPSLTLVVNPRAGNGRVSRELPRLVEALRTAGIDPTVAITERPGHATDLARSASEGGAETVVAVGGDGTVNEVVNGLVVADRPVGGATLGVVAAGSGADFARTFGFPAHVGSSLEGIVGKAIPIDVGRIDCVGRDGEPLTRYFVNVAEAGLNASVVRGAERLPRRVGRTRYVMAFWPVLARYRQTELEVTADGETFRGRAFNALVANARWFGGGMNISPRSTTDDGVAEIQVNTGPKRQAFTLIPKIYKGAHLPNQRIVEMAGAAGRIDSDRPIPVETDGELIGLTPMEFRILPGLLPLRVGPGFRFDPPA